MRKRKIVTALPANTCDTILKNCRYLVLDHSPSEILLSLNERCVIKYCIICIDEVLPDCQSR